MLMIARNETMAERQALICLSVQPQLNKKIKKHLGAPRSDLGFPASAKRFAKASRRDERFTQGFSSAPFCRRFKSAKTKGKLD